MKIYRLLTGKDNADFCHKITKALSEGWELYGSPQYTNAGWAPASCAQAVTKEVNDQPYSRDKNLTDY